ncbi:putative holin [Gilliamella apis]|uniref:Holin n=1 Tax=Gilliamella apis TaxID=1970738 RepID=A0A242NTZ8_9GAMM|nr:putative holin [Gilliamella apis]OTQ49329.1 hypothetical protein B6D06_06925 [Gilliamella apis]
MKHPVKKLSNIRLIKWYLLVIILFSIIALLSPQQLPVVAYKLSLVLLSAVIGYHLDRALFPYASPGSYLLFNWKDGPYKKGYGKINKGENYDVAYPVINNYQNIFAVVLIRRALIVSAVILGVTLGL